jgi:hypothetical protein
VTVTVTFFTVTKGYSVHELLLKHSLSGSYKNKDQNRQYYRGDEETELRSSKCRQEGGILVEEASHFLTWWMGVDLIIVLTVTKGYSVYIKYCSEQGTRSKERRLLVKM